MIIVKSAYERIRSLFKRTRKFLLKGKQSIIRLAREHQALGVDEGLEFIITKHIRDRYCRVAQWFVWHSLLQ